MKLAFILTHIPNPRMYKRINALKSLGEVHVICIRRLNQDIYKQQEIESIAHYVLDLNLPPQSQLLRRIFQSRKYKKFVNKKLKKIEPDIIYTEGLDSLIIANRYAKHNNAKVVYEVADLGSYHLKTDTTPLPLQIIHTILRAVEERQFKSVSLLVVTSMKYYTARYAAFFPLENVYELPNMPELKYLEGFDKQKNDVFTIGFIGCIRYLPQIKLLIDAAEIANINVFFAGGAIDNNVDQWLKEYCKDKNWVKIYGKYNYCSDISKLYSMADCVYSVYDADDDCIRLALPNRLYESIYCNIPIIAAKNTYLSELVNQWGVGLSVSHTNIAELVDAVKHLKDDTIYYNSLVHNCAKLQDSMDATKYLDKLVDIVNHL